MNEKQREFLVTRVEKYNKEADRAAGYASFRAILGAASVGYAVHYFGGNSEPLIAALVGGMNLGVAAWQFRHAISYISERTGLKNRVREIEEQIGLSDLEDNNTRRIGR